MNTKYYILSYLLTLRLGQGADLNGQMNGLTLNCTLFRIRIVQCVYASSERKLHARKLSKSIHPFIWPGMAPRLKHA